MAMQKNEAQEEAIETTEGQLLVIACPGSGKTTTLVRRIANMIRKGADPSSIIMMTFSRAAAKEMADRFKRQFPDLPQEVNFCTIHSFCFGLVQEYCGYTGSSIISTEETYSLFRRELYDNQNIMSNFSDFCKKLLLDIGNVKNRMSEPGLITPTCTSDKALFLNLYNRYEAYKEKSGKIDFDDMLLITLKLFKDNPALLSSLRDRYRYIQVDEYQDTNIVQAQIIYALAGKNGNLAVVGDDDQSIYGFRAASPDIMFGFTKEYPDAKVVKMGTNYRSRDEIITAAGNVISHNAKRFKKEFSGVNGRGGNISVSYAETSNAECQTIVKQIKAVMSEGTKLSDIAILFRTNTQAEPIAQALAAAGIPFSSTERVKSRYEGFVYRDIMTFMKIATAAPDEDIRAELHSIINKPKRYMRRGIEKEGMDYKYMREFAVAQANESWQKEKAAEEIDTFFAAMNRLSKASPEEALEIIKKDLKYGKYLKEYAEFREENPRDYLNMYRQFEKDVKENGIKTFAQWKKFAEKTIRVFEKKNVKKGDAVTISTMHKSKGLEWDTVFMLGCSDDVIPGKDADEEETLEEERRLFYVAMTRAKRILDISYTGYKNESRFIHEIMEKKKKKPAGLKGRLADL